MNKALSYQGRQQFLRISLAFLRTRAKESSFFSEIVSDGLSFLLSIHLLVSRLSCLLQKATLAARKKSLMKVDNAKKIDK